MTTALKPAAARVQAALAAQGVVRDVIALPVEARTSQAAADAVGVAVAQIAKSLVFAVVGGAAVGEPTVMEDGEPIMVIASGANRVDEARLGELAGGRVRRASPDLVREATGYVIGGVAPVGHARPLRTWIDRDLLGHEVIYAAAGLPECVFPLSPAELVSLTGGEVVDIAVRP